MSSPAPIASSSRGEKAAPQEVPLVNSLDEAQGMKSSENNEHKQIWYLMGAYALSNYLIRAALGFVAVAVQEELTNTTMNSFNRGNRTTQKQHTTTERRELKVVILSSFFMGYFMNNICAGLIASKFGGQLTLKVACCAWSTMTFVIPYVFDLSSTTSLYISLNLLLLGISCAPVFPASQVVFSEYTNTKNRSVALGIRGAGANIGALVSTLASPYLISIIGWRSTLKLYGSFGILFVIFGEYTQRIHGSREKGRRYNLVPTNESSAEELDCDKTEQGTLSNPPPSYQMYMKILSSTPLQAGYFCHFALNLTNYTVLSYMPTYFVDVLKVKLNFTGRYLVFSTFAAILGNICSGRLIEYILKKQIFTLLQTRRNGAVFVLISMALGK